MRYKLNISYDGKNYSGFQKQKEKPSIQENLEIALSKVLKSDIKIVGCGRTDAGVSAIEAVCHFDIDKDLNIGRTIGYTNHILPSDIRINSIENIDNNFNARYSAKMKIYEYYFYIGGCKPVYENFAVNIGYNISIENMIKACKYFIGEKDFSSFCASNTSIINKIRTIYKLDIIDLGDNLYKLSICGNGFLYNMVRIIMGTLVSVAKNKIQVDEVKDIILSKDRSRSGKTMPAKGLYLKKVIY